MSRDPLEGSTPHDIDRPSSQSAFVGAAQPGGSKLKFLLIVAGIAFGVIMGAAAYIGSRPQAVPQPRVSASPTALASPLPTFTPSASATLSPPPPPAPAVTPDGEATSDSGASHDSASAPLPHGKTE